MFWRASGPGSVGSSLHVLGQADAVMMKSIVSHTDRDGERRIAPFAREVGRNLGRARACVNLRNRETAVNN